MKRHKIVLYNPRSEFFTMPLALIAIGSALDPKRFNVRIIDGRLEHDPVSTVLSELDGALCFGVSVLTGRPIRDALHIIRAVKQSRPNLPVIWGGWHSSLFPLQPFDEPGIDITVQGQGEETFREIVERLAEGAPLEEIQGIACRRNGKPVQNPPRLLVDMNDLPRHNYNLVQVPRYYGLKNHRQLDYISSTGCFYRCTFCADPQVYNRKWTGIAPQRIAEELESLWKQHAFEDVAFQDETFFTYKERVVEMAEEFLRRNTGFTWTATIRADQCYRLSDDMMALCVRSGLRWVMIGIESGSQEMLDWMKKDITVDQIFDAAEKCRRHGIRVIFPFIVGFPNETSESVQATMEMVKKLRRISPNFDTPIFYYKPYPGSAIAREVEKNGFALPTTLDEWSSFDFVGGSSGPWVNPETYRTIERFKFYSRHAWSKGALLRRPFQMLARIRCNNDWYGFPIEKHIIERLRPRPELS